ncbi:hypothetical protein, partial [Actinocorallia lasiicapitis]
GAAAARAHGTAELVLVHLPPYPGERLEVGLGLSEELVELTAVLDRLEEVAAGVRSDALPVQVHARFSADPAGELAAFVAAADPDETVGPYVPAPR